MCWLNSGATSLRHHDAGLMASLLDPRYKELDFLLEDKKEKIIQKLRDEFNEMESNNLILHSPAEPSNLTMPFLDAESSLRSQKDYHLRCQSKYKKDKLPTTIDEVSNYLVMPTVTSCKNFSKIITNCPQISWNTSNICIKRKIIFTC